MKALAGPVRGAPTQVSGCTHLLTEDLQDGQQIAGVTVVNPFRHSPGRVIPA